MNANYTNLTYTRAHKRQNTAGNIYIYIYIYRVTINIRKKVTSKIDYWPALRHLVVDLLPDDGRLRLSRRSTVEKHVRVLLNQNIFRTFDYSRLFCFNSSLPFKITATAFFKNYLSFSSQNVQIKIIKIQINAKKNIVSKAKLKIILYI